MTKYIKITVNVPESHADQVRQAIGLVGAGKIGCYSFCSFSVKGIGRSLPLEGAQPAQGQVGKLEMIVEEKIETFCKENMLSDVVEAIKKAHPYEEPAITYYPVDIL